MRTQPKIKVWFLFSCAVWIVFFGSSCLEKISPETLKRHKNKTIHVDSISQTLAVLKGEERRVFLREVQSRLLQKVAVDSFAKLLSLEQEFVSKSGDSVVWYDYEFQKVKLLLVRGDLKTAEENLLKLKQSYSKLDYNQQQQFDGSWALIYYYKGDLTASSASFTGMLQRALKVNDTIYEFYALNNLGTIAFSKNKPLEALSYFKRAYKIDLQLGMESALLVNNIAACYLYNLNFLDAYKLLNKQTESLRLTNKTYEGILLKLNYVQSLQGLAKWKIAQGFLVSIEEGEIPKDLKSQWITAMLHQYASQQKDSIVPFLIKHREFIQTNNRDMFLRNADIFESFRGDKTLKELVQVFNIKELDAEEYVKQESYITLYYWNRIHHFLSELGVVLPYSRDKYAQDASEALMLHNKKMAAMYSDGMSSELSLLQSEFQLAESMNLTEMQSLKARHRTTLSIVLSILILCLVTLGYLLWHHIKRKMTIANIELERKTQETRLLQHESEYHKRMNALTAAIMDKSRDMAATLKPFEANSPELSKIIRELEQFGLLKGSFQPQAGAQIAQTEKEIALQRFPQLEELQDTEMRVFLMGNKGVKPKDIALALGISYQYVRNVRSKIRKLLSLDSRHKLESIL